MKHIDTVKVLFVGPLGFSLTLATTDLVLKCLIGLITVGYLIRKWYLMEKRK